MSLIKLQTDMIPYLSTFFTVTSNTFNLIRMKQNKQVILFWNNNNNNNNNNKKKNKNKIADTPGRVWTATVHYLSP